MWVYAQKMDFRKKGLYITMTDYSPDPAFINFKREVCYAGISLRADETFSQTKLQKCV